MDLDYHIRLLHGVDTIPAHETLHTIGLTGTNLPNDPTQVMNLPTTLWDKVVHCPNTQNSATRDSFLPVDPKGLRLPKIVPISPTLVQDFMGPPHDVLYWRTHLGARAPTAEITRLDT